MQGTRRPSGPFMPASVSLTVLMVTLLGVHLAGMGAFLTLPVLAPMIGAELDLPPELAGVHTGLLYAGALLSGPLAQDLVNRFGGVRTCQMALLWIACAIAIAAIGHPVALAASSFLSGVGHGPVTPTGSHLLAARTPPRRRGLVFSIKQTGVPAGAMMVAALAPAIAVAAGWRAAVLSMAGIALLAAIALQPLRAPLDAGRNPRGRVGWRGALRSLGLLRTHAKLRALTLMSAFFSVTQFTIFSFFVTWQVGVLGIPLVTAGLLLSLTQASGIAGRIGWGVMADRLGAPLVLGTLGVMMALAALLLALAGPGWPVAVIALLGVAAGATGIGWNGALLAETARVAPPDQVGGATAALGFVLALVLIVAPAGQAALVDATGSYTAVFGLCVALALAGAWQVRTLVRG